MKEIKLMAKKHREEIVNGWNLDKNDYYLKYKFKYSLIKDPSETSSLEYIKQQIKQYPSFFC